jgi:hypothetical protein
MWLKTDLYHQQADLMANDTRVWLQVQSNLRYGHATTQLLRIREVPTAYLGMGTSYPD